MALSLWLGVVLFSAILYLTGSYWKAILIGTFVLGAQGALMRGDRTAAGACLPSRHPRVLLVARREVVGLDRTGMPSCPGAANETSPPRPSFPEGSILPP